MRSEQGRAQQQEHFPGDALRTSSVQAVPSCSLGTVPVAQAGDRRCWSGDGTGGARAGTAGRAAPCPGLPRAAACVRCQLFGGWGARTSQGSTRVVLEEHWAGHARGFLERRGRGRSAAPKLSSPGRVVLSPTATQAQRAPRWLRHAAWARPSLTATCPLASCSRFCREFITLHHLPCTAARPCAGPEV